MTDPASAPIRSDKAEIDRVACELEGRHGPWAASIARFIADYNEQNGRKGQSLSWRSVCDAIEARTLARLQNPRGDGLSRRFH
jgi:hypothetical protein